MNTLHLRTFLWLRWRLFLNQMQRGGIASSVILGIFAVSAILGAIGSFIGAVAVGAFLLPMTSPTVQLLIWDGVTLMFLFLWFIGLLNELQRSEALTLEKFLHLPVSLAGVFVLNYLSSFMSLTLLFAIPILLGLAIGSVFGIGPALIVQIPLVIAFFFAVTALTYQFQGWLASLMTNKRRRRTIIVIVTLVFVLVCQVPNLINLYRPWEGVFPDEEATKAKEELKQARDEKRITDEEYFKKVLEIDRKHLTETTEAGKRIWATVEETAWFANAFLPVGWLALGGASAADGNILWALLATLAYILVGVGSLWRAYRTVLRIYTGEFTAKPAATTTPEHAPATLSTAERVPATTFLDRSIRWLPEQATIIALASLRGLLRAPEAKMILLSPLIMVVVFGGVFLRNDMHKMPPEVLPLMASGGIALILFSITQLAANQFGYDRAGFRIFILSPAPRREILMGKNLSLFPIAFVLLVPIIFIMQIMLPLRVDRLLALPAQFGSMFLVYCMVANAISILAPMPVAAGSLKPAKPKGLTLLIHVAFVFLMPMLLSPTLLPQGIEALLNGFGIAEGWPIGLVLTCAECAAIIALYRAVLTWQGKWLESRELAILETVTSKAE